MAPRKSACLWIPRGDKFCGGLSLSLETANLLQHRLYRRVHFSRFFLAMPTSVCDGAAATGVRWLAAGAAFFWGLLSAGSVYSPVEVPSSETEESTSQHKMSPPPSSFGRGGGVWVSLG